MEILLTRPVVIALALLGAAFSVAASVLQTRGRVGETGAARLNAAGYVFMGVSMFLFIAAGVRAGET